MSESRSLGPIEKALATVAANSLSAQEREEVAHFNKFEDEYNTWSRNRKGPEPKWEDRTKKAETATYETGWAEIERQMEQYPADEFGNPLPSPHRGGEESAPDKGAPSATPAAEAEQPSAPASASETEAEPGQAPDSQ